MIVRARPLDAVSYAPFGGVVMAAPRGEAGNAANQGTARRFDWLADLVSLRPNARPNLSAFRCAPNETRPVRIELLEKHPSSTQVFLPMNASRYLVVVARGGEKPDLGSLQAFVAHGAQGVTYAPGVWHHPMIALDAPTDFACLVWEDGTSGDCTAVDLREDLAVELDR